MDAAYTATMMKLTPPLAAVVMTTARSGRAPRRTS